ncbi:MAG: hypothetical protein J0H40_17300 [Rhizobiales bacterium]|nr:hypothetical protein [Hyphomicrobiales bacterium]
MRSLLILAALIVTTAVAHAEQCRFGSNRPAIDTMERRITPGGTTISCDMKTVTMQAPSGRRHDVKVWTFQKTNK